MLARGGEDIAIRLFVAMSALLFLFFQVQVQKIIDSGIRRGDRMKAPPAKIAAISLRSCPHPSWAVIPHKGYPVFVELLENGKFSTPVRVEHEREAFRQYLESLPQGSDIAIESTGHWYWLVDEMERAGHRPHLAEPLEAKKRMGKTA
jgi:hypothetical protein